MRVSTFNQYARGWVRSRWLAYVLLNVFLALPERRLAELRRDLRGWVVYEVAVLSEHVGPRAGTGGLRADLWLRLVGAAIVAALGL